MAIQEEQIKAYRQHNEKSKLVTLEANITFNLFFAISNGQLKWSKENQLIRIQRIKLIPGIKIKQVDLISEYPGDGDSINNIVDIFNTSLGYSNETFKKFLYSGVKKDTNITQEEDINESIDYSDDNLGKIVKHGSDSYYLIARFNEEDDTYDLIYVYNSHTNEFYLEKAKNIKTEDIDFSDIDTSTKYFYNLIEKSDNEIYGGKGINSFKIFSEQCISDYDGIVNKSPEKFIEKDQTKEEPNKSTNSKFQYESDDIYSGKNPEDYKNIWQYKNTSEIKIKVDNLYLIKNITYDGTKEVIFTLNAEELKDNIINQNEAKKTKILVNNEELRPKTAIGFLQQILPFIKIRILLDK
jgi:hypothetical protein